jgi:hypothetical protein
MITNIWTISNKYRCGKKMANYLIYERNFPLLGISGKNYYFADTCVLREVLKQTPIWIKILNKF